MARVVVRPCMNKDLFRLHPSAFILAFQRRPVNSDVRLLCFRKALIVRGNE
jgi:hypothetical protein